MFDQRAKEITITGDGISECTYRPSEANEVTIELKTRLFSVFPEAALDENDWELIGFTSSNNINYFEDTIGVTYKFALPESVRREFNVPDSFNSLDYYSIKYLMRSKQKILKVYDKDFWKHPLPQLPEGSSIASQFGIGYHFGSEKHIHMKDVYFIHDNRNVVESFYKKEQIAYPSQYDDGGKYKRLYGCLYNIFTFKTRTLKRYVYPDDLKLLDVSKI